jgi:hypothetical protein
MFSQSLDGSDRTALEAIYEHFNERAEPGELLGQRLHASLSEEEQLYLVDRLTGIYDRSLHSQYGGEWYAGRQGDQHDTYNFVLGQTDLIERFVGMELQGRSNEYDRYNIAALLSKRFEQYKQPHLTIPEAQLVSAGLWGVQPLDQQLLQAGNEARSSGRIFNGCGASVGPDVPALSTAEAQLKAAGYGNTLSGKDEDEFGPLVFKCKKGHTNRRPRGKLIDKCYISSCHNSVGCK